MYKAKVCRTRNAIEELRLVSLSDEPGFGFETNAGTVLVKGDTMEAATELLLRQYREFLEVDSTPYWQHSA